MKLWLLLSLFAVTGCFPEGACDPDQIATQGLCIPSPFAAPPPDGGAEGDAAPDDANHPVSTFGTVCTTIAQCGPDADVCAMLPTSPEGFCSHLGCLDDPSLCPAGWVCFDASAYVSGVSLCIPE